MMLFSLHVCCHPLHSNYAFVRHASGMSGPSTLHPPPFTAAQPQASAEGIQRSAYTAAIWALYETHVG